MGMLAYALVTWSKDRCWMVRAPFDGYKLCNAESFWYPKWTRDLSAVYGGQTMGNEKVVLVDGRERESGQDRNLAREKVLRTLHRVMN